MNSLEKRRLYELLGAHNMPELDRVQFINAMQKPPRDAQWVRLQAPLDNVIRSTRNGRARWRANRAPTYTAYLALLERTQAEIANDARNYDTPADAAKAASLLNSERAAQGKRLIGDKDGPWWTWIPPHIYHATILAFESLYASPEESGRPAGRRIAPFATLTQRTQARTKWLALLDHVHPHMKAGFDVSPQEIEALTRGIEPMRQEVAAHALRQVHRERYRAACAAAKIIRANIHSMGNLTVPIDWTHVLDAPERSRLRAAEVAAGGDGYTRDRAIMLGAVPPAAEAGMGYVEEGEAGRNQQ